MAQSNLLAMNQYPSVSSIHSMISIGYLPPGHGYIPKKVKPDKPYGPSYITILNRTWRGPGRTCLRYALVAFCLAVVFYTSAALYFGHRNVHRLIVRHSEPLGMLLLVTAILLTSAMFYFIHRARLESNRWRSYLRFRPDGLFHVVPVNEEYSPTDPTKLATGTYGPRAVKEIPKPRHMKRSRPGSRAGGRQPGSLMTTLAEDEEDAAAKTNQVSRSQENLDGPQRFNVEKPEVLKPEPLRPGPPAIHTSYPTPTAEVKAAIPVDGMPVVQQHPASEPRYVPGMHRMPTGRNMYQPPESRQPEPATPAARQLLRGEDVRSTPEPRSAAGPERMPPATSRSIPEPRMIPGQGKSTPKERPPAGRPQQLGQGSAQRPGTSLPTPQARAPTGRLGSVPRQTPEPRMVPGQGKAQIAGRMAPGSFERRPPGLTPPSGISNQALNDSDL